MENQVFDLCCREATRLIRFPPDRKAGRAELLAHMEDHRNTLKAEGMAHWQAEQAAVKAMGSAQTLAPELAKVHRPFWGYLHWLTRAVSILLCSVTLLLVVAVLWNIGNFFASYSNAPATLHPGGNEQWKLVQQVHPEASVKSDGYLFRLPDAILWKNEREELVLCFNLQTVYSPFRDPFNCSSHFWAVDSQGNHYATYHDTLSTATPHVSIGAQYVTEGLQSEKMRIIGIPSADIQWIELHYNRDGRDLALRIDLKGGTNP